MPQCVNVVKHEQWQSCDRCGRLFPMSKLAKQKGLMLCTTRVCWDNLEIERHASMVERVMNPGSAQDQEGVDTRAIDRGFFEGFDEQTF